MTKNGVPISGRSSFVTVATVHVLWSCVLLLLLMPPPSSVSSFHSVITAGQHQHQRNLQWQPLFVVNNNKTKNKNTNRRTVLDDIISNTVVAAAAIVTGTVTEIVATPVASAAVAVDGTAAAASASSSASQFGDLGTRTPLPAAEMMGVPGDTTQFTTFANGIKIKDFKVGTGTERVSSGTTVSIQCQGRLINTNAGITFYNTKNNNPDGFGALPLTFTLGQQAALPGLEFGLIGMKKGGIRRIVIPPDDTWSYTAAAPQLEPKPTTPEDQRALDAVVKNPRRDSTVMFDVKLERFK